MISLGAGISDGQLMDLYQHMYCLVVRVFLGTEGSILEYIGDINVLGLKQSVIPKGKTGNN